jgi:hypothetical protein
MDETNFSQENLLLTAAKHYRNNHRSFKEFEEDLRKAYRIRSLLTRRSNQLLSGKDSIEKINRILLNHVIVFFNVFSIEFAKSYLFYVIDEKNHPTIKTILIFLSFMTEDEKINTPLDLNMIDFLRIRI